MQLRDALCAGLMCLSWGGAVSAQEAKAPIDKLAGAWEGTVGTRRAAPIHFAFAVDSMGMHGAFDAPASGVLAWPVRVSPDTGGTLRFTIPNGWVFHARVTDEGMSGKVAGNGKDAPFVLHRTRSAPPLPYAEEEVRFRNGEVALSGTLLLPRGQRRMPAVVCAHGSGAMDRTADNFLGDYLARRGIAVLLYDKRGVGKSTGEWRRTRLEDLAADAVAGVRLLRTRSGIDSSRVGVAGRSQGGQLAVISASRYPEVAFAIDICGSLVAPWQQMNYEAAATMARDKFPKEDSMAAQAMLNEKWRVASTGIGWDSLAAHIRRVRAAKAAWLGYVQLPDQLSDIRESWEGQMDLEYGPVLARLSKPILALFGERDTSTPTAETVAALRSGLRESRNVGGTIRVYAGADHALLMWQEHGAELELPPYPSGYPEILAEWIHALK